MNVNFKMDDILIISIIYHDILIISSMYIYIYIYVYSYYILYYSIIKYI